MRFRQTPLKEENYDASKVMGYLKSRAISRGNIPDCVIDPTRKYSIPEIKRVLNVNGDYIEFLVRNDIIKMGSNGVDGSSLESLCKGIFSGLETRVKTKMYLKRRKRNSSSLEQDNDSLHIYFKQIQHYPSLSREEEIECAIKARGGDETARNKLVSSNLKFVVSVSKEYQGLGLSLLELISEGNMGILRAAERFDETKEFKFISYAVWWIRQAILEKLANSRTVKIPVNLPRMVSKINKATERLSDSKNTFNPQELVEDIAQDLNIKPKLVEDTLSATKRIVSLDMPREENVNDPGTLLDNFPDYSQESPDEAAIGSSFKDSIRQWMNCLTPREAEVIKLYFGLDGQKALNLEEIGQEYRLTRERIRQIKEKALHKMKQPSQIKFLKDFKDLVY